MGGRTSTGSWSSCPCPDTWTRRPFCWPSGRTKDVDCFHPFNVGQLMIGEAGFQPCTPAGVMRMLKEYGIDPAGKHCVIVGRSNIVGKPQAMLMLRENATVTVCHTKTRNLKEECLKADILVAARRAGGPDLRRHGEGGGCGSGRGHEPQRGWKTVRRRGL